MSHACVLAGLGDPTVGQLSKSQEQLRPPASSCGRAARGSRAMGPLPKSSDIRRIHTNRPLTDDTQGHTGAPHSTAPPLPVPYTYTHTTSHTLASNTTHTHIDPKPRMP